MCGLLENIHKKKLLPHYLCKSQDNDHQCADLVIAWLPQDKRKFEHKVGRLMFVYILLSKSHRIHMALAIKIPDILLM